MATNRRAAIQMTREEVDEFLHGRRTMSVATIGPDGWPHVVAMWYGFLDGAPSFETYAKSQKVLNLRRDPRITCLVEDGDAYEELRGVELVGTAEIVEDPDVVMEAARSVVRRYWPVAGDDVELFAANLARKRVAVKVHVERVVSWDHAKL
jgi:PPOX class probable F420-dependent enzyme